MNVLILTPDAVGSTLLQRMLTIYMQFHKFDRPVINLHELTNGLAKYYSPEFNRELVSKQAVKNWGYYQSLEEVVELLSSVDHYKTSRLAHYHIRRRGDTIAEQIPFYNYLNENFFIIACRRTNVFEHALSMTLNKITKKLNVYDAYEKIDAFYEIYQSGVTLDSDVFVNQLNAYRDYISWSEQYFNIAKFFNYEQDIPQIEKFILDLPVFGAQSNKISWESNFGITFNSWNKMHYANSDIGALPEILLPQIKTALLNKVDLVADYQKNALPEWPAIESITEFKKLPTKILETFEMQAVERNGIISLLDAERQQQLLPLKEGYDLAQHTIKQMIDLGIIISGPPIKKQTMADKQKIIKNFDQCLEIYNNWCYQNSNISLPLTHQSIDLSVQKEQNFWHGTASTALIVEK
jgi:hypothetical protein